MINEFTFKRIVLIAACAGLSVACSTAHPDASGAATTQTTPAITTGTTQTSPTPQSEEDKMPRTSAQEAVKLAAAGQAIIVDVRSADAYKAEHAKGALSVPLDKVEKGEHQLPKDKKIITYCT
jgi:3-mercaptopyruvate sulfurtransferase SseA